MKCPKCGAEASLAFGNRGVEIQPDYEMVRMSIRCQGCISDIELEYVWSKCELDEEVV